MSKISPGPNFELLKDAYAIIGGIPEEAFHLESVITDRGPSLDCGTIACAMGWLSLHPEFGQKLGAKTRGPRGTSLDWNVGHVKTCYYADAAAELFGIAVREARNLFSGRGGSDYDRYCMATAPAGIRLTDKQLWMARVRRFLDIYEAK